MRNITRPHRSARHAHSEDLRVHSGAVLRPSLFATLVEKAPEGIAIADPGGTILYANPACQRLLGYGSELLGMNGQELIAIEDRSSVTDQLASLNEAGEAHVQMRLQRKDGSIFPGVISIFVETTSDGPSQVIGIVRDISEQQRLKHELDMANTTLNRLSDTIISTQGTYGSKA